MVEEIMEILTLMDFEWDYRDDGTLWLKRDGQIIEVTEYALTDLMDSWRENNY